MKWLLLTLALLCASTASASVFMLRGMNGACSIIERGPDATMYFCSKALPLPGEVRSVHFLKIDVKGTSFPKSMKSYLVIENELSESKMQLDFDESYSSPSKSGVVRTYMWYVPEVFVKLFKEDVTARFKFFTHGEWHNFVLSKEEKNEIRFIANFEAMKQEAE